MNINSAKLNTPGNALIMYNRFKCLATSGAGGFSTTKTLFLPKPNAYLFAAGFFVSVANIY